MWIDHYRLRVGIAYDPDACVATEFSEIRFELGPEIGIFQIVNWPAELPVGSIESSHTGTACTQMRIIVRTVEKIGHAALSAYRSKETTHGVTEFG